MNNDGGPSAFPRPASEFTASGTCPDGNDPITPQDGMSLRDYFAIHASEHDVATYLSGTRSTFTTRERLDISLPMPCSKRENHETHSDNCIRKKAHI